MNELFKPHAYHAVVMPRNQFNVAVLSMYDVKEGRTKTILSNPNTVVVNSVGQKLTYRGRKYVVNNQGQFIRLN